MSDKAWAFGNDDMTAEDLADPEPCRLDQIDGADARNHQRALFAGLGVKAFAERVGGAHSEPLAQMVSDLLADLMHLADAMGEDFEALVNVATLHYTAEIEGEG